MPKAVERFSTALGRPSAASTPVISIGRPAWADSLVRDWRQRRPLHRVGVRRWGAIRTVLLAFVLSRVWIALFVYLGHAQRPFLGPVLGGWEGVANWWLNPWTTYDSQWFLHLAVAGYEPLTAAVFPLYALLLRLAGPDQLWMAAWGVAAGNLAFAAGLLCLYRLTTLDHGEPIARAAIWLLAFFPTAAVFSAVYSESLFLLLIVLAFLAVRRHAWRSAGMWALLASLTRNSGPIVAFALGLEWLRARRSDPAVVRGRDLSFAALPLVGFGLVQVYLLLQLGGILPGVRGLNVITRRLSWPWEPVLADLASVASLQSLGLVTLLNVAAAVAVFAFAALRWKQQPLSYTVLLLGVMLMHLMLSPVAAPHTNGALRYLSTTFPFVQLLAVHCLPLVRNKLRLATGASIYLAICATFSYLFGLKWFVTG